MANRKPHLVFTKPQEGVVKYVQPPRYPGDIVEQDDDKQKDYTPKREDYISSLNGYFSKKQTKIQSRSIELKVPAYVEYIQIRFHDYFDSGKFEKIYRNTFGLTNVSYEEFNTVGVFAVIEEEKFNYFIKQIDLFINADSHINNTTYNKLIKYIKEFTFYSNEEIIKYKSFKEHLILNIVDNVELFYNAIQPIEKSLISYLEQKSILYNLDIENSKLELFNTQENTLFEILANFDIIHSVNSNLAGIVRPNIFNLKEVVFGFNIINTDEDLPIIGVLDTGISNQTPLSPLLLNVDEAYNLTNTSVFQDNVDHGTGVACFAALGNRLIPDHNKDVEADAKLLCIKIADTNNTIISEKQIIDLIKKSNTEFGIKVFTLNVSYIEHLNYNQQITEYAYALDNLAYELDILIFISTGNNSDLEFNNGVQFLPHPYPDLYDKESLNLNSPAESYNNFTVGSIAGNFENNSSICFVPDEIYPTLYTRTSNINWNHESVNTKRKNKHLFKPDVVYFGGDYDTKLSPELAGIKILSVTAQNAFYKDLGTSYSAPLVCNIAAKLLRKYPSLYNNIQSIKALIINGSISQNIEGGFNNLEETTFKDIYGNGIPNVERILFSSDSQCTFLLEDEISPENIQSYEFNVPNYFLSLNRKKGFIKVDATICFKFKPIKNSHLVYCPIHMAFGIFRNLPLENNIQAIDGKINYLGINGNKSTNYKLSESWSQDYYYKPKLLSNVQKVSFNFTKSQLIQENCKFKIAVNCKLHKLLNDLQKATYNTSHSFSLVVTLTDLAVDENHGYSLYDELMNVNEMEIINNLDADLEIG